MKYQLSIVLYLTLLSSTCKQEGADCHNTIKFINKSGNTVFIHGSNIYPDTALRNEFPSPMLNPQLFEVKPSKTNEAALRVRDCVEAWFGTLIPSDTMVVYVFDAQVLATLPWDTVKARKMFLKRYDLSLQDLRNKDWTLNYP